MTCMVRPARSEDAAAISAVIVRALRETSAKDYAPDIIARIELNFDPEAVLRLIGRRTVFVATIDGRIVGTASLDGTVVRTVFVLPEVQARGIGRQLMNEVEREARTRNVSRLTVSSSIGAETFYAGIGFGAVRDEHFGQERTIIMEKYLGEPQ